MEKNDRFNRVDLLRSLFNSDQTAIVPGVLDAGTARLIEMQGFECALVSGSLTSLATIALPDNGSLTSTEVIETVRKIAEASKLSLIVDIDTGYGIDHQCARFTRQLMNAGAAAVILEDGIIPVPVNGSSLVSPQQMIKKIGVIKSVFGSSGPLLIARTNARSEYPVSECASRLSQYTEAGADAAFLFQPKTNEDLKHVQKKIDKPQVAVLPGSDNEAGNVVEVLENYGAKLLMAPSVAYRAALWGYNKALKILKKRTVPSSNELKQISKETMRDMGDRLL